MYVYMKCWCFCCHNWSLQSTHIHTHTHTRVRARKGMQMHANADIHPASIPQDWRCCRVLQCFAARCSVLQRVTVCCSVLPWNMSTAFYACMYTSIELVELCLYVYKHRRCLPHSMLVYRTTLQCVALKHVFILVYRTTGGAIILKTWRLSAFII